MSIINEQLIGSEVEGATDKLDSDVLLERDAVNPFPKPPEWETAKAGFGGFTYAPGTDLQTLFDADTAEERIGPNSGNTLGTGTTYDATPVGDDDESQTRTLLGQMGAMLNPTTGDETTVPVWSTVGSGKQIAHSVMSSGSRRSLRDTTSTATADPDRPIHHASGGAFNGYDYDIQYDISDWFGQPHIDPTPNVWIVAEGDAQMSEADRKNNEYSSMDGFAEASAGGILVILDQASDPGQEGTNVELFNSTDNIKTGLRRLPVSPTAE